MNERAHVLRPNATDRDDRKSYRRNDIVLDSFLGSGTTLLAAEKTGRICYAIELDPRYVDTAVRRWQTLTGKTSVEVVASKPTADFDQGRLGGAISPDRFVALVYSDLSKKRN